MNDQPSYTRDFFVAGGTLRNDAPSYVARPADDELHRLTLTGNLCYVLTTRQMGKSSLMNRLGRQLQAEGVATALIDLTAIGTANLEEWYVSLLDDLQIQLSLDTDAESWWESQAALSPVKRFTNFFRDVALAENEGQIAVFIDEVDSALNLDFSDDFFAAIRAIYNQTLTTEDAGRLSFVLLGVATPNELIKSQHRTPFNVGERIELEELGLANARVVFSKALPLQEPPIIDRVYYWTSGHPYLTQRVCQTLARDGRLHWTSDEIDKLAAQLFFTDRALVEESNLQFVNGRLLASPHKEQLLRFYQKIHRGKKPVTNDERDPVQAELKLYGLVKIEPDGHLGIRNRIYRRVFDQVWIKQHRATPWKRVTWIALILVTLLSIGLSVNLWRQAQQSNDLLAQTYIANFTATENPTLRLDNLAQLLALGGRGEEAVALFTSLLPVEQAALFTNPATDLQPQIESVIEAMYVTQSVSAITADAESTQVLTAMLAALRGFERLENPTLLPEIDNWLRGRTAVLENDLSVAQLAYSVALSLNVNNPSTRYERALAMLALPDPEAALADLTVLLTYDASWQNRVLETVSGNPQLHAFITADNSPFAELASFVPTPTVESSSSAPTEPTSINPPRPTPEQTPHEQIAEPETAIFIETLPSIPHAPPKGRIVYTCFVDDVDQICAIEADGSNASQLTFTDTTNWTASWTPDSEKILFSSLRSGIFALYETSTSSQNARLLLAPEQGDYTPIASPDGTQIAFTRAEDGSQNIWVMDWDGRNARPLTFINGDALSPTWSPDGQQIAYGQRLFGEDDYTLIIMNADGANAQMLPLPLTGIGGRSDWSPDGQWLAFYAGPPNDHDIYLASIDGSFYYKVTDDGDNLGPSFSPDSNWLVFTSSRDGDNDLYLIQLDGTGLTSLTDNDSADWQPRWGK
ncbi:MAG: hypothetical protein GY805_28585 [Chloroflexi bacterium]|nr:hypothetical protein [Chloroflexota bacterium]